MPVSIVLDFRAADLRTRERFHLGDEHAGRLYAAPRGGEVRELVLLSTCNRVELYGAADPAGPRAAARAAGDLARRWTGDDEAARQLLRVGTVRAGADAAGHLLRVSAGLESQVLGDAQVLGQVRRAYRAASDAGAAGPVLHRLFETALRTGKRVASETGLTGTRSTVGGEAASTAARRLGSLAGRRCVVVGCGKTGEQAARRLAKLGAGEVVLVNRSPERAERLAAEVRGRAAPWETMHQECAAADVVIVATAAEVPVIRAASLSHCRRSARAEAAPLLALDLAMPRNVEPEVAGLEGVALLDLDALRMPLAAAEDARRTAVPAAERIVAEELGRFAAWRREAAARAAVQPLRAALEDACRREGLSVPPDAAARIMARLLARPMSALRAASLRGEPLDDTASLLRGLFEERQGAGDRLQGTAFDASVLEPEPLREAS